MDEAERARLLRENASLLRALHATGAARARAEQEATRLRLLLAAVEKKEAKAGAYRREEANGTIEVV